LESTPDAAVAPAAERARSPWSRAHVVVVLASGFLGGSFGLWAAAQSGQEPLPIVVVATADLPTPAFSTTSAASVLTDVAAPPSARAIRVRANWTLATVKIGDRTVKLPKPAKEAEIALTSPEAALDLDLEVVATDGRKRAVRVLPTDTQIDVELPLRWPRSKRLAKSPYEDD
jgi:hypothetical protein